MERREFSYRYSAAVSILLIPNLAKIASRESCPVKTDSQNLLISRVPPGEKGRETMAAAPGKSAN